VRRRYNDWRQTRYRLSDLAGLHYQGLLPIQTGAVPSEIYGFVWCNLSAGGEPLHTCLDAGPHRMRVCIKRNDNPLVFAQLLDLCASSAGADEADDADVPDLPGRRCEDG
jgi:hypothetical protein